MLPEEKGTDEWKPDGKNIQRALLDVRNTLSAAGYLQPRWKPVRSSRGAADKTRDEFYRDMGLYASKEIEERVECTVYRRLKGEPVAYLTGDGNSYGIDLEINSSVLVPRIDTELLAQEAIRLIEGRSARVLDLCCGSGCVGIAIAANVPDCKVILADVSSDALEVAGRNVALNGLTERVKTLRADAHRPPVNLPWAFDMIVCNPPYVAAWEMELLDASVRNYEPRIALLGGETGLEFYPDICTYWKRALKRGACLLFGAASVAPGVCDIMTNAATGERVLNTQPV